MNISSYVYKIFYLFIFVIIIFYNSSNLQSSCVGRFLNPLTDICFKCLFPIKIAGISVTSNPYESYDTVDDMKFPVCMCRVYGSPIPVAGIPVSFWEPARIVDVTKHPLCMVALGGLSFGDSITKGVKDDIQNTAFYHVHFYIYPVLYWLELLTDFVCLEKMSIDIAYLTEFDPLWNDDAKSAIINPEALLFGSIPAQTACAMDCTQTSTGLSNDHLFWCSGCQGSLYPFTGNISGQNGGIHASTLLLGRMIAKLHRELICHGYTGKSGLCDKYPMPIIKKSQYRYQMVYPIPETISCKRIGQTEISWNSGREYPVQGEDFAYLIWRKRDCCMF